MSLHPTSSRRQIIDNRITDLVDAEKRAYLRAGACSWLLVVPSMGNDSLGQVLRIRNGDRLRADQYPRDPAGFIDEGVRWWKKYYEARTAFDLVPSRPWRGRRGYWAADVKVNSALLALEHEFRLSSEHDHESSLLARVSLDDIERGIHVAVMGQPKPRRYERPLFMALDLQAVVHVLCRDQCIVA